MKQNANPTSELLDKTPPSNLRLEREALCGLMAGNERCAGILFTGLHADDFHDSFHRALFVGLRDAWHRDIPVNTAGGLTHALAETGLLGRLQEHLGTDQTGAEAVALVMASEGAPGNAEFYLKTLRQLGTRRKLVRLGMALIRDAHNSTAPVEQTIATTIAELERANAA